MFGRAGQRARGHGGGVSGSGFFFTIESYGKVWDSERSAQAPCARRGYKRAKSMQRNVLISKPRRKAMVCLLITSNAAPCSLVVKSEDMVDAGIANSEVHHLLSPFFFLNVCPCPAKFTLSFLSSFSPPSFFGTGLTSYPKKSLFSGSLRG